MLKPEAPKILTEDKKYDHGFSEEEVYNITSEYKRLQEKVKNNEEISLEEQKIIFKHFRIHRTETFVLNDKINKEKEDKVRKPKEKKVKEPKIKKPTKKQLKERKKFLIDKQLKDGLTIEETEELIEIW